MTEPVNDASLENGKVVDSAKTDEELLAQLEAVFLRKNLAEDFKAERLVYTDLIPKLSRELEGQYKITRIIDLGSTAAVLEVYDWNLEQRRALKLPRPTLSKLSDIIRIVRTERVRLAALNHQNVIKIFTSREIDLEISGEKYSFPYFVMEFLDGVQDFDDFVLAQRKILTAGGLIENFRDILAGLSFLHRENIIHCDIKPANILKSPNRPTLIADLGYAKHIQKIVPANNKLTSVTYTRHYAHPDLVEHIKNSVNPYATVSEIPRDKLRPAFDLFALGRSMQEVLVALRSAEREDPESEFGNKSILSPYQWSYLGLISKRLLDGFVEKRGDDELESDLIPELPEEVMPELRYISAEQALDDVEKLLHLYDLEGEIEELNPNLASFVQIPGCRVPLTHRVNEVINHPTFARLAQITQLGFVSLVYPGATHTRFEHVLGTFARCCEYMKSLWYDSSNCLFQAIMSKEDIELGLLAALVHDIAQYPMAHDLTEISSRFAHEKFTEAVLQNAYPGRRESLAEVIKAVWHWDSEEVLNVIHANEHSTFRHRILNSLIDGPLDCDKLDYLGRDSIHLGIKFGGALDADRLVRNLTLAYKSKRESESEGGRREHIHRLDFVGIGVAEKALVVAQSLLKGRKDMFTQVYWQHTTRAVKAMLGFVIRRILLRLETEELRARFWYLFKQFIFSPMESVLQNPIPRAIGRELDDELGIALVPHELLPSSCSHLGPSDDAAILFFWQFATEEEKRILRAIQDRQIYRRLAVLSGVRKRAKYQTIYSRFRIYRLEENFRALEEQRQAWEGQVISLVSERLDERPQLIPIGHSKEQIIIDLKAVVPLILVDIPVKAISLSSEPTKLHYLMEDVAGVHSPTSAFFPDFDEILVDVEESGFDVDVGKIRVLAHPQWRNFLDRCVKETKIIDILTTS
jgi:serine/threonine protein kinase